jgi:predicted ATP-dependent serine protease
MEDLELFVTDKKMTYGRQNKCKECRNKEVKKGGRYYQTALRNSLAWKQRNKERLKKYDREKYYKNEEVYSSHRKRRILFDKKVVYLNANLRTNICSFCNRKHPNELTQQTTFHHWFYDKNNLLNGTLELCTSCHKKLPKTVWVECACGVKYDGWLFDRCPICQTKNPIFETKKHAEYTQKIRNLF